MDRRKVLKSAATLAATGVIARPMLTSAEPTLPLLSLSTRTIEVNKRAATVYGLTGPGGRAGLTLVAGQPFAVTLRNGTSERTLVHWHGLTPPWEQDGVPDAPAPLLGPDEERSYTFPLDNGGTHWMHAHTLQEQKLLAAPLIVRSSEEQEADEQEVIVMLHDFSFAPPEELLTELRKASGGGQVGSPSSKMMMPMGHGSSDPGSMPSLGTMDLNDIDYDAYLANDRTLEDPEVVRIDKAAVVRLRIINAATATAFTVKLGSLEGELVAVDGQPVQPTQVASVGAAG